MSGAVSTLRRELNIILDEYPRSPALAIDGPGTPQEQAWWSTGYYMGLVRALDVLRADQPARTDVMSRLRKGIRQYPAHRAAARQARLRVVLRPTAHRRQRSRRSPVSAAVEFLLVSSFGLTLSLILWLLNLGNA